MVLGLAGDAVDGARRVGVAAGVGGAADGGAGRGLHEALGVLVNEARVAGEVLGREGRGRDGRRVRVLLLARHDECGRDRDTGEV